MTSHNQYPGSQAPEMAFQVQHAEYLDNFSADLSRMGAYANQDPQYQQAIENMVDAAVNDAMKMEDAPGFQLAVVAEALGATRVGMKGASLLDMLQRNPLLGQEDQMVLNGLANNGWSYRQHSDSEEQATMVISQEIGNNLMYLGRAEEQGNDKSALRVALLAYGAGAALRAPQYRAGEQLMSEVHKHIAQPEIS